MAQVQLCDPDVRVQRRSRNSCHVLASKMLGKLGQEVQLMPAVDANSCRFLGLTTLDARCRSKRSWCILGVHECSSRQLGFLAHLANFARGLDALRKDDLHFFRWDGMVDHATVCRATTAQKYNARRVGTLMLIIAGGKHRKRSKRGGVSQSHQSKAPCRVR